MAKRIKQYRYYANDSESNFPAGLNLEALATGSAFEGHIIDLKIQSYPGTKFYLNDSTDWVMVGGSGEYHLGLNGNYEISFLRFDKEFLEKYFGQNGNLDAYLIVDIVYNAAEEGK